MSDTKPRGKGTASPTVFQLPYCCVFDGVPESAARFSAKSRLLVQPREDSAYALPAYKVCMLWTASGVQNFCLYGRRLPHQIEKLVAGKCRQRGGQSHHTCPALVTDCRQLATLASSSPGTFRDLSQRCSERDTCTEVVTTPACAWLLLLFLADETLAKQGLWVSRTIQWSLQSAAMLSSAGSSGCLQCKTFRHSWREKGLSSLSLLSTKTLMVCWPCHRLMIQALRLEIHLAGSAKTLEPHLLLARWPCQQRKAPMHSRIVLC